MMPALHNYVTVDTPAFLSNPENLQIIYNMCKTVSIINKQYKSDAALVTQMLHQFKPMTPHLWHVKQHMQ